MNRDTSNLIVTQDTAEKHRRETNQNLNASKYFQIFSHGNTKHQQTQVYQWFNLQSCELSRVVKGERSKNIDAVVTEVSVGKTNVNTAD